MHNLSPRDLGAESGRTNMHEYKPKDVCQRHGGLRKDSLWDI